MTEQELIQSVSALVEDSASRFNATLGPSDARTYDAIVEILKDLDTKGGKVVTSVKNLKLISKVMSRLNKIVVDAEYKSNVKEFISAFNDIFKLQNQYYKLLEDKFKPTDLLQTIREEAINSTIQQLTEDNVNIGGARVREVLRQNITSGGSYKDLMNTMAGVIKGEGDGGGAFSSRTKTATITSVAQYSRHYSHTVAEGLNFTWYQYVGSTITTTRCFCHAMVKKRFFHISEIPALLKGDFPEYEKLKCDINEKTGLPEGMIKGTDVDTFMTYAGGWNCQHSIFPVPAGRVPAGIRAKFEKS